MGCVNQRKREMCNVLKYYVVEIDDILAWAVAMSNTPNGKKKGKKKKDKNSKT